MGGRAREAGSRAKPGNQLVYYIRFTPAGVATEYVRSTL